MDVVDSELLTVLVRLREHYACPVTVTSGCRCERHNTIEGGSKNSQHIQGKAADIQVKEIDNIKVARLLDHWYPDQYGIGSSKYFTHIDVRSNKARWKY